MEEVKLLDHGYCRFIESYGSDQAIVEAARTSTDKGFLGWEPGPCPACEGTGQGCKVCEGKGKHKGDKNLLAYLYNNKHATPFEFAGMVVEIQAPIFVFREWHRHRTQAYNEMSARYTPLPDLNYIPTVERLLINSKTNKQAGTITDAEVLDERGAEAYRTNLCAMYESDELFYQQSLKMGVPKELARIHLPVGRYSRMRAVTSLRNWMAFMTLRSAPAAQFEIRTYSQDGIAAFLRQRFPRSMGLFEGTAQ
jgi:thymidylate synthase (FAD)